MFNSASIYVRCFTNNVISLTKHVDVTIKCVRLFTIFLVAQRVAIFVFELIDMVNY